MLKNFFRDFDPNNTGYVSESRFCRALQTALPRSVNYATASVLAKLYADKTGAVNYRALHEDTSNEEAVRMPALSHPQASSPKNLGASLSASAIAALTPSTVQDKLIRLVSERRVRLNVVFEDFDKMRTGRVNSNIFKSCMCVGLTNLMHPEEVDVLAQIYASETNPGFVEWKQMCDFINLAFTGRGLERAPQQTCSSSVPWQIAHRPRIILPELANGDEERVQAALDEIQSRVLQSRSSLIDIFRDFDRQCKGTVSGSQFERCLAIRKILPSDPNVVELLKQKYGILSGGGDRVRIIRYRPFIQRVSEARAAPAATGPETTDAAAAAAAAELAQTSMSNLAASWRAGGLSSEAVMHEIRKFCTQRRVRVAAFFEDADKLRKGSMNVTRFRRCLKNVMDGSDITATQLQAIEDRYCISGDLRAASWAAGQPVIDWRSFVADVDAAMFVSNLESNPTLDVMATTQRTLNEGKSASDTLNSEERARLDLKMRELAAIVLRQNTLTRPLFAKFDRQHRGTITWTQFRRGVTMLCGGTHFNDIMPLIAKSRFAVRQFGESDESYLVNYKAVCDVIDPQPTLRVPSSVASPSAKSIAASKQASAAQESKSIDVDAVMARIREHVKGRGLNIKLFFEDFDGLRKGLVTEMQFIRGLDTGLSTNFRLTRAEQIALANSLRRPGADANMVDYRKFVATIDQRVHLETDPNGTVPSWKRWSFEEGVSEDQLAPVLDACKKVVRERRINVKSAFQNYDKQNSGSVTTTQFLSTLQFLNMFPPTEAQRNILLRAYSLREPGQEGRVYYLAFAKRVDP